MGDASADRVIEAAIDRLAADGFVAYPTETVWGLGACADRPAAIDRLIAWKGRGSNAPLAVLVAEPGDAFDLGCTIETPARALLEACWPGPLMLVLPCSTRFAPGVAGEGGALGVRCSPHPICATLARAAKARGLGPLTSTSLNRSGDPPVTRLGEARALARPLAAADTARALSDPGLVDLEGDAAMAQGEAGGESPSTVVDCTGGAPRILREGAIPTARIEAILGGAAR